MILYCMSKKSKVPLVLSFFQVSLWSKVIEPIMILSRGQIHLFDIMSQMVLVSIKYIGS